MAETASQTPMDTRKDVYGIINDRFIEHLEKGVVPWRVQWRMGGIPTNLVSGHQYRGINMALLGTLGYARNLFVTENQLQEINAFIKPNEKPHVVAYWNKDDKNSGGLGYYKVYNIAQCAGISLEFANTPTEEADPEVAMARIIATMPHSPAVKHKEATAFYDPLLDVVNMPKKSTYASAEAYDVNLMHQLIHSTGHHTRLDRIGIIQMSECGYPYCSIEEMVAEICMGYFLSLTGCVAEGGEDVCKPVEAWLAELKKNSHLIFTAFSLSMKAIDFILDRSSEAEE